MYAHSVDFAEESACFADRWDEFDCETSIASRIARGNPMAGVRVVVVNSSRFRGYRGTIQYTHRALKIFGVRLDATNRIIQLGEEFLVNQLYVPPLCSVSWSYAEMLIGLVSRSTIFEGTQRRYRRSASRHLPVRILDDQLQNQPLSGSLHLIRAILLGILCLAHLLVIHSWTQRRKKVAVPFADHRPTAQKRS